MSTTKLLNVAPKFDTPTEVSFEWNKDFVEKCSTHNPPSVITSLLESKAEPIGFKNQLKDHNVLVVFDHGTESAILGQNKSKLLTIKEAGLLKDKKVFAMACLTAKELGVEAYHRGCKEYWGAIEPLGFTLEDAHLFGEVFIEGATKRFCQDIPINEVYMSMIEHFNTQIAKTSNPWSKIWLQKNAEIWVVWYDDNEPERLAPKGLWRRFVEWFREGLELDIRDTGFQLV
jgi:hypothetical protein